MPGGPGCPAPHDSAVLPVLAEFVFELKAPDPLPTLTTVVNVSPVVLE